LFTILRKDVVHHSEKLLDMLSSCKSGLIHAWVQHLDIKSVRMDTLQRYKAANRGLTVANAAEVLGFRYKLGVARRPMLQPSQQHRTLVPIKVAQAVRRGCTGSNKQ
jgi:hypothetical protein